MKTSEARVLGNTIAADIVQGKIEDAYSMLAPILAQRTPFAILRHIAAPSEAAPQQHANAFMERIAFDRTEGGWVVIARILEGQLERDLAGAFSRCRQYVVQADIWYATDILGEGVTGPALLLDFKKALNLLEGWRIDENSWVRRTLGVSVHFWAKRAHGDSGFEDQAVQLLDLLAPLFEEKDINTVKGVGWGLKTMGRYYPEVLVPWLSEQLAGRGRKPSALMLRKSLTFLSPEQRSRAAGK